MFTFARSSSPLVGWSFFLSFFLFFFLFLHIFYIFYPTSRSSCCFGDFGESTTKFMFSFRFQIESCRRRVFRCLGQLVRNKTQSQFTSVQGGIYGLGKTLLRSTASVRIIPTVAGETVAMFVRLTMALYSPSARWQCLKLLNTSDLHRRKLVVIVKALPAGLSARSLSLTLACPRQ